MRIFAYSFFFNIKNNTFLVIEIIDIQNSDSLLTWSIVFCTSVLGTEDTKIQ